jgi:hypothetical protein
MIQGNGMRSVDRQPKTRFDSLGNRKTDWSRFSLLFARVGCIVVFACSVVVFVVNLPTQVGFLRTLFQATLSPAGPLSTDFARTLQALGLSASSYVVLNMVLLVAAALASFLISGIILWRRADDWVALLGAAMLLSVGVVGPTLLTEAFEALVPAWGLLTQCLMIIAGLSFFLFFLLFPSGHFVPRWTPWLLTVLLPLVLWYTFLPRVLFSSALLVVRPATLVGMSFCLVLAQVYRYRSDSNVIQRQQTKWVVFGVIGGLVITSLGNSALLLILSLRFATAAYSFLSFPVTTFLVLLGPFYVGMAITRARLWDIDVIINRTLVYGTLTATLALLYVGLVFALQFLLRGILNQTSTPAIVLSTLAIYVLFQPLRHRIQLLIDRRFYRRKYDAVKTVAAFNATLRQEVDLEQLREHLLAVVQETVQPAHISLWLRPPAHGGKQRAPWRATPPGSSEGS